ncbi:hypothetical protein B7728_02145 [Streptococcus oralis subsp. tigurinus]|uniref:Phage protein n=1 Tax=Streptococcus oralis subsp. tigurinus TaxID=1077464 RepID=A0A1X1G374_STROR|nr:DUF1642 domain-containing protein [Streptococcus oralis]ORO41271.1 hypothetical protein B7728_02145 [Streptococcus oralis subsp. tigurinus]
MNVKKLIEKIEGLNKLYGEKFYVALDDVLDLAKQLDEPETGHADEAPRYVKNVLARLRELPLHDREVWLKSIMGEFEQDFSHAKWREGYEQGKFEGVVEREKVIIPQFVAGIIEYYKGQNATLYDVYKEKNFNKQYNEWLLNEPDAYNKVARAFLDGYELEKEKKYKITLLNRNDGYLYLINQNADLADKYGHFSPVVLLFTKCTNFSKKCYELTKKEVVSHDFGWVFDCKGIQIEEVE